jgi:dTDP-glucose 4,6-dehydratase
VKVLVTGGAGFIGSAVVRRILATTDWTVVNLDALTYAGNLASLGAFREDSRHVFAHVDLADLDAVRAVFAEHAPDGVLHLAAETHVDRSIDGPLVFVRSNVLGTVHLLMAATEHFRAHGGNFRMVHVSTDEVFGSLGPTGIFTETSPYDPRSPYSASKASADHFARAWHHTYGLPVVVTNCSNNYGPCMFPEKLVPLVILRALAGLELPVYGTGANVRDWLFVEDHADGLLLALQRGKPGRSYNFGGGNEQPNLAVVRRLCALLDERRPAGAPHDRLIRFVADRPGHDLRYAVDFSRAEAELGWRPRTAFDDGLRRTVDWYLDNPAWVEGVRSGSYRLERLGRG